MLSKLHKFSFTTGIFKAVRYFGTKIITDAKTALIDGGLKSGMTVMVGGFGICGTPVNLIKGVHSLPHVKDLTIVSNNMGIPDYGLWVLFDNKQISRCLVSYFGGNRNFEEEFMNGKVEVGFYPQGTLAEAIRAAGAGIPAFYTPTAFGTSIGNLGGSPIKMKDGKILKASEPKETRKFDGRDYVLEKALHGDIALVNGWKADRSGNVMFRGTARNLNPEMAKASKFAIVEVQEIVDKIDPAMVHLPGIYVDRIVVAQEEKRLEIVKYAPEPGEKHEITSEKERDRLIIANRVAQEFTDGMYINLGVGIPTLAPNFVPPDVHLTFQSENGLLGIGPYPKKGDEDPDYVNAGKEGITITDDASLFSSSESFAIIRGGHLDCTVLGAFQVSQFGDIASWMVPDKIVKGPGGAMDLTSGSNKVIIALFLNSPDGEPKILKECTYPLTALRAADKIITEKCVFEVDNEKGLILTDIRKGFEIDSIRKLIGCDFMVSPDYKFMDTDI